MYEMSRQFGRWLAQRTWWHGTIRLARAMRVERILSFIAQTVSRRWFWTIVVPAVWLAFGPGDFAVRLFVLVLVAFLVSSQLQAAAGRFFSALDKPIVGTSSASRQAERRRRGSSGKRVGKAVGRGAGKLIGSLFLAMARPRRRSRKGTNIYKSWGGGG